MDNRDFKNRQIVFSCEEDYEALEFFVRHFGLIFYGPYDASSLRQQAGIMTDSDGRIHYNEKYNDHYMAPYEDSYPRINNLVEEWKKLRQDDIYIDYTEVEDFRRQAAKKYN